MLKKEFFDALKRLMECLLLLLVIPVAFVFDKYLIHFGWSFSEVFEYFSLMVLIIYPLIAGVTIFQSERKDRAFEYLFSLPLSRFKIILYKIFPRFLFLILLIVASIILSIFKDNVLNEFNLLILFFISLFLSFAFSSVVIGLVGIGAVFWLFYSISQCTNFIIWRPEAVSSIQPNFPSQLISAAMLLIPLAVAFWITFKNLDVKPLKLQIRLYLFITLSTLVILVPLTVVFYKKYWVWLQTR